MIMIVYGRLSLTHANKWWHVKKTLNVLEHLVDHGSERITDEDKEHVYQISTLSDFRYIDSSRRDLRNNARRKSQSIVALVIKKEYTTRA